MVTGPRAPDAAPAGAREPARAPAPPLRPPPGRPVVRVFLAVDSPLLRRAMVGALGEDAAMSVCGQGESEAELLAGVAPLQPEVVVLALAKPGGGLFELVRRIQADAPARAVLVADCAADAVVARRLWRCGARGLLARSDGEDSLREAVRVIAAGQRYTGPGLRAALAAAESRAALAGQLTDREEEIMGLVADGATPREIALRLGLSVKTVESHRQNIKEKLGLGTTAKLAHFAFQCRRLLAGTEGHEEGPIDPPVRAVVT